MTNKSIYRNVIISLRCRENVDFCELFLVVSDASKGQATQEQFEKILETICKKYEIDLTNQ